MWNRILPVLVIGMVWVKTAFASQSTYDGRFEQVTVESGAEDCASIFAPHEFTVRHFLLGPTGRTSVLFFVNNETGGWLEGRRFVGRYDDREIYAEETVEDGSLRYEIVSRGLFNHEVLLVDVYVVAYDMERDTEYCRVVGEFSGFSR